MKHTISIFKRKDKESWTVCCNGTCFNFDSEKEAFMFLRNQVEILESAVESAIETYLSNKR